MNFRRYATTLVLGAALLVVGCSSGPSADDQFVDLVTSCVRQGDLEYHIPRVYLTGAEGARSADSAQPTESFYVAFLQLPETGFIRLNQLIGDPNTNPPIPPIYPVSKSTWWEGVRTGRFPKPIKLGPRITAWRVEDIRALIEVLAVKGCK